MRKYLMNYVKKFSMLISTPITVISLDFLLFSIMIFIVMNHPV